MAAKYASLSPYVYCANNPVKLVDPNGKEFIGAIVGAIVGATSEIVSQTITNGMKNLSEEKGFFEGWGRNLDLTDVGVSALMGGLNGACPGAGKAYEFLGNIVKSTIDYKAGDGFSDVLITKKKNPFVAAIDLASLCLGGLMGKVSGLSSPMTPRTKSDGWLFSAFMEGLLKGSACGITHGCRMLLEKEYFPKIYRLRIYPLDFTSNANIIIGTVKYVFSTDDDNYETE